jgi:hypothetical protein
MTPKIKLSQARKEDYVELATAMNRKLKTMPIRLSLNLGELFVGHDYTVPVNIIPYAVPIVERKFDYYEIGFGVRSNKDDVKQIATLAREGHLKKEVVEEWIKADLKDKDVKEDFVAQELLVSLLWCFETDKYLFNSLVGHYYDVRYHPETNILYCGDAYSGRLRNQGLMKTLFRNIGEVVDFDDLSGIKLDGIIEKNTNDMFDALAARISEPQEICKALESEYVKSPYTRLLYGLGFKQMHLGVDKYKDKKDRLYGRWYLCSIEGRKSDKLEFFMHQEKD